MIPDALVGTVLGHELLQFDCDLKRLSATMLHPAFEPSAAYWKALHERLTVEFGVRQTIHSFQKVWLVPTKAVIYYPSDGEEPDEVLRRPKGVKAHEYRVGYTLENELSLLCKEDDEALSHSAARGNVSEADVAAKVNSIAVGMFKDMIIPVMEHEIRFGESFARLRQIYSAMLLATWVKRQQAEGKIGVPSVDSGLPTSLELPRYNIAKTGDDSYSLDQEGIVGPDVITDGRDFYAEYLDLFRCGIYQTTRRQYDAVSKGFVTRAYSSGGLFHYGALTHQDGI